MKFEGFSRVRVQEYDYNNYNSAGNSYYPDFEEVIITISTPYDDNGNKKVLVTYGIPVIEEDWRLKPITDQITSIQANISSLEMKLRSTNEEITKVKNKVACLAQDIKYMKQSLDKLTTIFSKSETIHQALQIENIKEIVNNQPVDDDLPF